MNWDRKAAASLALAILALMAVSCQSAASANRPAEKASQRAAAGAEVRVVGTDMKFDPARLAIPAGQPTTIAFENRGIVEHDLVIESLGFRLHVLPGQTEKGSLTVEKPGEYEVVCTIQGHKDAGMIGKLVVSGRR